MLTMRLYVLGSSTSPNRVGCWFHLGDIGTHPSERLGAGRASLELRQVEDADALE